MTLSMWTFLVELAAVEDQFANLYPETLFSHGEMPDEAGKNFEADNADDFERI
jgi:hypothetical protein